MERVKTWRDLSPEEQRRRIEAWLRREKVRAALEGAPPEDGIGWYAPLHVPLRLNGLVRGGAERDWLARIEASRSTFAGWYRRHGPALLEREQERIARRLEALEAEAAELEREAVALIEAHGPEDPLLRRIELQAALSPACAVAGGTGAYGERLREISDRIQEIGPEQDDLRLRAGVLRNVLARTLRADDLEPWEALAAAFTVTEGEVRAACAALGVPFEAGADERLDEHTKRVLHRDRLRSNREYVLQMLQDYTGRYDLSFSAALDRLIDEAEMEDDRLPGGFPSYDAVLYAFKRSPFKNMSTRARKRRGEL
ncbi:hypothetical protein AWN76_003660 [Rhodothermaceae bacterium RA]|nr:hypothetical protein AWN76_003660 [Rhodothermaceae bacterium RA]